MCHDNQSRNISADGDEDLAMCCLVNNEYLVMHKIFLLLLLFFERFFITIAKEDGEDELHEVYADDGK